MNSKIFDEYLVTRGGRLDIKRFNENSFFHYHKKTANNAIKNFAALQLRQPPLSAHFDYVNNPELNAVAFKVGEKYFTGLYAGTIFIIHGLFLHLLSHPSLLKNIGDPTKEVTPAQCLRPGILNAIELVKYGSTNGEPLAEYIPHDPKRKLFARTLASVAIDFLVHHELAHILYGHLDFKRVCTGTAFIAEFDKANPSDLEKLDRQTLEMDADCFAVCRGVEGVLSRVKNKESLDPTWRQFFENAEDGMRLWFLAINLVFRLSTDLHSPYHPPAHIRQSYVGSTAFEYIQKHGSIDLAKQIRLIDVIVTKEAEEAYAVITGKVPDFAIIKDSVSPEALAYTVLLLNHWKELRPVLLPFARLPLVE